MPHNLQNTIALLERTPAMLDAFLRDLPESWTQHDEGEGTWSVFDVIGHLIHGERTDWIPRTRLILEHGDSRPFEKFDRFAQAKVSQGKSLNELLDEFARLRAASLAELQAMQLQPSDLERRGKHSVLGGVTLSQLLATWPAHDLTHIHQISRIMAHQYKDDVGPWTVYLGVMRCSGHSD